MLTEQRENTCNNGTRGMALHRSKVCMTWQGVRSRNGALRGTSVGPVFVVGSVYA